MYGAVLINMPNRYIYICWCEIDGYWYCLMIYTQQNCQRISPKCSKYIFQMPFNNLSKPLWFAGLQDLKWEKAWLTVCRHRGKIQMNTPSIKTKWVWINNFCELLFDLILHSKTFPHLWIDRCVVEDQRSTKSEQKTPAHCPLCLQITFQYTDLHRVIKPEKSLDIFPDGKWRRWREGHFVLLVEHVFFCMWYRC